MTSHRTLHYSIVYYTVTSHLIIYRHNISVYNTVTSHCNNISIYNTVTSHCHSNIEIHTVINRYDILLHSPRYILILSIYHQAYISAHSLYITRLLSRLILSTCHIFVSFPPCGLQRSITTWCSRSSKVEFDGRLYGPVTHIMGQGGIGLGSCRGPVPAECSSHQAVLEEGRE